MYLSIYTFFDSILHQFYGHLASPPLLRPAKSITQIENVTMPNERNGPRNANAKWLVVLLQHLHILIDIFSLSLFHRTNAQSESETWNRNLHEVLRRTSELRLSCVAIFCSILFNWMPRIVSFVIWGEINSGNYLCAILLCLSVYRIRSEISQKYQQTRSRHRAAPI